MKTIKEAVLIGKIKKLTILHLSTYSKGQTKQVVLRDKKTQAKETWTLN